MSVRSTGGAVPPPTTQAAAQQESQQEGAKQDLRARNAAGKQAHSSPKSEYQRPHRVHTSRERHAAQERHHQALLQEEAVRHAHIDIEQSIQSREVEKEEDQKLKGVNLDERRKKHGRQRPDEDAPDQETAEEAAAKSLGLTDGGAGKYFQDMPVDRLGDMTLTSPNEMKRLLGPSVRFAQHAMLLAEARLKEGAPREEALRYLASIYLGVADRAYANKALREFGASTGIVDLYPLELMRHLLEHVPSFLSKVSTASFLAAIPREGYKAKAGVPLKLSFEPTLRIRGFAIKHGEKPGYLLEPTDPLGTYQLTFGSSGNFTVMMSALDKNGTLHIQEFRVDVAPGDARLEDAAALKRERAAEADTADAPPAEATAGGEPSAAAPEGTAARPSEPPKPDAPKKPLTVVIPRRI